MQMVRANLSSKMQKGSLIGKFGKMVQIWKLGPNQESGKNGGFQNGLLLITKNGFGNGFITRSLTLFVSGFPGSKELSWWAFLMDHGSMDLKEMDLRIFESLENQAFLGHLGLWG